MAGGQKKKSYPHRPQVSHRDMQTLSRLVRRIGPEAINQLIAKVQQEPIISKKRGSKKQPPLRHSLLAALYYLRCYRSPVTTRYFSRAIYRIVRIRYARSFREAGPSWTESKNVTALEQDLRRAFSECDEKSMIQMIYALIWWRFTTVNPRWGFMYASGAHLIFEPRRPNELFRWIDQFLTDAELIEEFKTSFDGYTAQLVKNPNN